MPGTLAVARASRCVSQLKLPRDRLYLADHDPRLAPYISFWVGAIADFAEWPLNLSCERKREARESHSEPPSGFKLEGGRVPPCWVVLIDTSALQKKRGHKCHFKNLPNFQGNTRAHNE